jgi:hypothetical protein
MPTKKKQPLKSLFEMRKVIDPHDHMPEEIIEALFYGARDMGMNNGSHLDWQVGEWFDDEDQPDLAKVDKWLLANPKSFQSGEDIIILYWW